MNPCLFDLFQTPAKRDRFAKGLPIAFDMVRQRMPRSNPAVGILREHVILGFFVAEFGKDRVIVPEQGNKRGYDVVLCDCELSIKTRTRDGAFKILWTVDTQMVEHEISNIYKPEHDLLLINIFWDMTRESVFYIPLSVQQSIYGELGYSRYLSSSTGTNNRGIEIRGSAVSKLKAHPETISFPVTWETGHMQYPLPWDEWEKYWKNEDYFS